jgi:hypothetical protein
MVFTFFFVCECVVEVRRLTALVITYVNLFPIPFPSPFFFHYIYKVRNNSLILTASKQRRAE